MTKSTVYIKNEPAPITVVEMKEGILYRVEDSMSSWYLDIVIRSGDIFINLLSIKFSQRSIKYYYSMSVRELPTGASIALTQE